MFRLDPFRILAVGVTAFDAAKNCTPPAKGRMLKMPRPP